MKWQILCGWLSFWSACLYAVEFLYPVACQSNELFYLIYQKTPHHIELWEWDATTKEADQLLFSRFTPAGFRLLPSGEGFSFVDNGILKIKKFLKRSPRIIEFDAPIYQVELINWIDDALCYASGKYKDNFGIFQIDYEGEVVPVYLKKSVDCMYPQKINDSLFYIERDEQWHCRIMQTKYTVCPGETFDDRLAWYWQHQPEEHEIMVFEKPIVFLSMISETEGFVVSHPAAIHAIDITVSFDYYQVILKENGWYSNKLFSFQIPAAFLFAGNPSRLYESIMPLLPKHYANQIIFSSVGQESQDLSLFMYDRKQRVCFQLPNTQGLFPPVQGFSGGILRDRVGMGLVDKGGIYIELVGMN
jgi:hypothetical protein